MSEAHEIPPTVDSAIKKAVLGDNSSNVPEDFRITVTPPEDITPYLGRQYADITTRFAELSASAEAMPDTIENDIESGKAGDLVKEIRLWDKKADGARSIEKEPFQKGGATVDSFFKNMTEKLEKAKKRVLEVQTTYLNKKKDEERRRLEAEALKKREAEEKARVEAAQAEERKRVAEEARVAAEAAATEARENKDELEQGRLDAETALANAKLKKAIARRDRDEDAFSAASVEVTNAIASLADAKERLRGAREAQRVALADAEKKAKELRTATTAANNAGDTAEREGAGAAKIEKKLEKASDGDLSRTRGEHGSVNTLARHWEATIVDMQLVHENVALIIGLIDPDVIQVAVNKRMRAGNRDVPGVTYEEVSDARS